MNKIWKVTKLNNETLLGGKLWLKENSIRIAASKVQE